MADQNSKRWPYKISRGRPSFLTRTATDDAGELGRRSSLPPEARPNASNYGTVNGSNGNLRPATFTDGQSEAQTLLQRARRGSRSAPVGQQDADIEAGFVGGNEKTPSTKQNVKTDANEAKLGTFSGVFVPTSLNVLSILMFIRFGFILGQTGLLGMLGLLIAAYIINVFTTLSISAVASNGTVRGGGAYYLISRSLGAEFGGSIGLVSYGGFVLNTGMNAVGLVDCLIYNFGTESGIWSNWLPETGWYPYLWSTCVVIFCVMICLAGSSLFSRASNLLLCILMLATISIPVSTFIVEPFKRPEHLRQYTQFTGPSIDTIRENLFPRFTKGAAGSQVKGRETWADMFGILFPATGGIFAGASMSGDLRSPGKSIPSGTLYGILLTFIAYTFVIAAMACSITRLTFYRNVNVVQDVNVTEVLILLGEIATTSFSVLMGIIGPAKQFQAIAKDGILPGLSIFGQGTAKSGDPINAIMLTWFIAQLTILLDINSIASIVTMSYLLMNFSLHLACLLLKVSSAPNFRPSFRYFNVWTALLGAIISIASMFFVDAVAASLSIAFLMAVFMVIHYTTPPKAWGSDVTSGLVYHQVRKYLLRLKTESVKYWRPQILLFVNDSRRGLKLIKFANNLKKGGLLLFGHVIVTEDFSSSVSEAKKQKQAWNDFIDLLKIKAFVNVVVSPSMEWGARNLVLSAGLGGMRPNIVMMGFFNLAQFREEQPLIDIPEPPPERKLRKRGKASSQTNKTLPTDTLIVEKRTDLQSYVLSLEDLVLKLRINVAVATGFDDLELPGKDGDEITKKYIDLWPIQMSASIPGEGDDSKPLTTVNFDTYTLILQLGCILNTVRDWKRAYKLRVAVFVEYEYEFEDEKARVIQLLNDLRIQAEVLVFYLASGDVKSYNHIVSGEDEDEECARRVHSVLEDEEWWTELQQFRQRVRSGEASAMDALSIDDPAWIPSSFNDRRESLDIRNGGLRRLLERASHRSSYANLSSLGVMPTMRTQSIDPDIMSRRAQHDSDDSDHTDSDSGNDYFDDDSDSEHEHEREDESNNSQRSLSDMDFTNHDRPTSSKSKKSSSSKKNSSKKSSRKSSKRNSRAASPQAFHTRQSTDQGVQSSYDESPGPRGRYHTRQGDTFGSMDALPAISPTTSARVSNSDSHKSNSHRLQAKSPTFSASPIAEPVTRDNEMGGPSIMFADAPHPRHETSNGQLAFEPTASSGPAPKSIYARGAESRSPTRSFLTGTSATSAVPVSFNNLPCRAQHLILNELIAKHSEDAAVIFTTLPAPSEGTWKSETDSLRYITDLEVLTQGLGPVLMVHSNSMTVTTNL